MNFVLAKCPSCSGDLQVPDDKDFIICMYCGSTIKVREAIRIKVESNLPNLIKLIEEAIKNQNYSEAYEYCNRVLENDLTNYMVWYYKGIVVSKIAEINNLRVIETQSCFENAVNNCPEDKITEFKITVKDILYVISTYLFKLNENSIRNIESGEDKVNMFFDNSRKIIQLLWFIPNTLKIEENKTYNEIISLCRKTISSRSYTYHAIVAGTQQIKTGSIFISSSIRTEFDNIINNCHNRLRVLNPEEYAEKDAKLLAAKKKNKRNLAILGIVVFVIFVFIFIKSLINNVSFDNQSNDSNPDKTANIEKSDFQKGEDNYKEKKYIVAINYFEMVLENDSNYTNAQDYILKCNEKLDEQEEARKNEEKKNKEDEKKRNELEKKYNKMFGGNGWLHEKQAKLLRSGFEEYKSGYEKAPDGSQQIATYYKKYEYGFYTHVRLQYSYSLENHYVKVWVEKY